MHFLGGKSGENVLDPVDVAWRGLCSKVNGFLIGLFQKYLALQLIKIAYARGIKASHYDRKPLSVTHFLSKGAIKKDLKKRGLEEVKKAINIYKDVSRSKFKTYL